MNANKRPERNAGVGVEMDCSGPGDQSGGSALSRFTSASLNASSVRARGSERANAELGNASGRELKIHARIRQSSQQERGTRHTTTAVATSCLLSGDVVKVGVFF